MKTKPLREVGIRLPSAQSRDKWCARTCTECKKREQRLQSCAKESPYHFTGRTIFKPVTGNVSLGFDRRELTSTTFSASPAASGLGAEHC